MQKFLDLLGCLCLFSMLALSGLGLVALIDRYDKPQARALAEQRARQAERDIADIGRRAQAAILAEALRRARHAAPRGPYDRPDDPR